MKPFCLGLTGSIGMGKSTTAAIFAAKGVPVWDADQAVHKAYDHGGEAVAEMASVFPDALENHAINRNKLRDIISHDPSALTRIEAIIHPIIAKERTHFIKTATADLVVLDIPLLFETGREAEMDATLLVTAPPEIQRARVMARPGMTEARFQTLLTRQMSDAEKRARATHIVETLSIPLVETYVSDLIRHLSERSCLA